MARSNDFSDNLVISRIKILINIYRISENYMKKRTTKTIGELLIGSIFLATAHYVVIPYFYPQANAANIVIQGEAVAKAQFIHADPADAAHYGQGDATFYQGVLQLHDNFKVGRAPKAHVYLVSEPQDITPKTPVHKGKFIDLGRLKDFSGQQSYVIPDGTNLSDYATIVIWCERFNVLISPATINFH